MLTPNVSFYAGGPFNYKPTQFPTTLKGWWSAKNPLANSTIPADGSALALLKDLSANANDFSQIIGGLQPIYKRSVFNSQPAISFPANRYLEATLVAGLQHSITLVLQSSNTDLGAILVAVFNGDILAGNGYGYIYDNGISPGQRGIFYAPTEFKDNGNLTTNFEVVTIGWDGVKSYLRVNGIDHVITDTTLAPVTPTGKLFLGVDNPDPSVSDYFDGYISEVIIRNKYDLSQVMADEKYLITNWGI